MTKHRFSSPIRSPLHPGVRTYSYGLKKQQPQHGLEGHELQNIERTWKKQGNKKNKSSQKLSGPQWISACLQGGGTRTCCWSLPIQPRVYSCFYLSLTSLSRKLHRVIIQGRGWVLSCFHLALKFCCISNEHGVYFRADSVTHWGQQQGGSVPLQGGWEEVTTYYTFAEECWQAHATQIFNKPLIHWSDP